MSFIINVILKIIEKFYQVHTLLPNLQKISFTSDKLKKSIQLKVAASAIRTVEKKGGLDEYLLKTSNTKLPMEALKIKKQILSISK